MCAVAEELGGADVERDERGDDAERAPSLRERDAVGGGGELPCRARVTGSARLDKEKRRSAEGVPAPSSAKVMVRKKKRTMRPMFLRNDATLKIRRPELVPLLATKDAGAVGVLVRLSPLRHDQRRSKPGAPPIDVSVGHAEGADDQKDHHG